MFEDMQFLLLTAKASQAKSSGGLEISDILAIVAIIVSVGTLFWQSYKSEKHHTANLEAEYYKVIYWDYLLKKIPQARNLVVHSKNGLTGESMIIEVLNNLRKDSLFFKYKDPKFYEDIKTKTQMLEDLYTDPGELDNDNFINFYCKAEKLLSEIYRIINKQYLGKKKRSLFGLFKKKNLEL